MAKSFTFLLFAFMIVSVALAKDENEITASNAFTDEQLEENYRSLKADIIDKENLECNGYEKYCQESHKEVFNNEEICKIILKNVLCKGLSGIAAMKESMREIDDRV